MCLLCYFLPFISALVVAGSDSTFMSNLPRYTGGNWISLVQGGGGWEVRVKGNLSPRTDSGRINSSPTTAVSPVFRLRHGATHTITIPGLSECTCSVSVPLSLTVATL